MVSQCPSSFVHLAASTIALKAYSSYTPGPIDLILGRKHWGDSKEIQTANNKSLNPYPDPRSPWSVLLVCGSV